MNSPVDKIKERLSIVDVISSYLQVNESGKNYKARCPFHNEKTPSFFISPDRGTYYCFGCGVKGDIFSFVQQFEGTDFLGSLKLLAERSGVELSSYNRGDSKDEKELWYEIMEEATKFFELNFQSTPEARAYLRDRGLSDQTIESFRIGYAKDAWRSVSDYLLAKGYKSSDLEIVGLIKKSEKGIYDRFRSRVMFPISDSSGRVIAFSGRIFGKQDTEEAKYLNSPDTPLYNKSNVLFGIDKAKLSIRSRGYSIVVEGQMDLILSHQALFSNTVAVSGTALADSLNDSESKINNLGLIRRLSPNVIFAYDGDEAGIRAAGRSAMIALSLDMQVKVAILPEGKDPADIILENPESWKEIIKNSVNIVSFHIDRICKSTTDIRIRGRKVREVVFPFLSMVSGSIERSAYVHEIYSKTGIPESAIIEDFDKYEKTHGLPAPSTPRSIDKKVDMGSRKDALERKLFGIIFWAEQKTEQFPKVKEKYTLFEKEIGQPIVDKLRRQHEPFSDTLALEAEMWYGTKNDTLTRDLEELMLNLEEEILIERASEILEDINQKERTGDKDMLKPALEDYQKVVGRIEAIKNSRSQ
jgi:DNA primase